MTGVVSQVNDPPGMLGEVIALRSNGVAPEHIGPCIEKLQPTDMGTMLISSRAKTFRESSVSGVSFHGAPSIKSVLAAPAAPV